MVHFVTLDHCVVRVGLHLARVATWDLGAGCGMLGSAQSCWTDSGRVLAVLRCGHVGVGAWLYCVAALACPASGWGVEGQRTAQMVGEVYGSAVRRPAWRDMSLGDGSGHRGIAAAGRVPPVGRGSAMFAVLLVFTLSLLWGERARGAVCSPLLFVCVRAGHLVLW